MFTHLILLGIPFLAVRINKRSMFISCYKCASENKRSFCECSEADRSWVDTYSIAEVETALEYGYEIIKVGKMYNNEDSLRIV